MGTSREQEIPFPSGGKSILYQGKVIRVIEDQQPPVMRGEPVFDGSNDFRSILFLLFWKVQQRCQFHKTGSEFITGGSIHP
jgi:hypothetical protein